MSDVSKSVLHAVAEEVRKPETIEKLRAVANDAESSGHRWVADAAAMRAQIDAIEARAASN